LEHKSTIAVISNRD